MITRASWQCIRHTQAAPRRDSVQWALFVFVYLKFENTSLPIYIGAQFKAPNAARDHAQFITASPQVARGRRYAAPLA